MISHKHKCIFIHIPKCAGTSIEKALGHFDGHEGRGGQDHRSVRMIEQPFPQFACLRSFENIKDVLRRIKYARRNDRNPNNVITASYQQYIDYFKFTVVRDPWDRAYSWYKNATRDELHRKHLGISEDIEFEEFLKRFIGSGFLRPQLYWLKNFKGQIDMNYIARFENLEEDYNRIIDQLGVDFVKLPHELNSGEVNYRSRFNKVTKEIIDRFYQEEIQFLNYKY
ncbi:Sulfotransferase family protein [Rubritalea squalenifaciens DSM 18772]|uniref:Sulfotransferase family protein n=1 Tax=Rubritalea squalenifaciens DSM 18772 TaxID=1123071 RepID=A0A1M6QZA5_9BACT|nr:sulfotransferase family 2 domain-containing protein [Rubritalea squalenifaciens]SHK25561.1 Sulfotransferase family protein [Rubritalea squalenifaciens DSM 18772]